jgi:hypothetical protein
MRALDPYTVGVNSSKYKSRGVARSMFSSYCLQVGCDPRIFIYRRRYFSTLLALARVESVCQQACSQVAANTFSRQALKKD